MKKLFALLLVAVIVAGAFLAGIVAGPNIGSTEWEFGEVELGEMEPVTDTSGVPFIIMTRK